MKRPVFTRQVSTLTRSSCGAVPNGCGPTTAMCRRRSGYRRRVGDHQHLRCRLRPVGTHELRRCFGERNRDEVRRIADTGTFGRRYVNPSGARPGMGGTPLTRWTRSERRHADAQHQRQPSGELVDELVSRVSVMTISLDSFTQRSTTRFDASLDSQLIDKGIDAVKKHPRGEGPSLRIRASSRPTLGRCSPRRRHARTDDDLLPADSRRWTRRHPPRQHELPS